MAAGHKRQAGQRHRHRPTRGAPGIESIHLDGVRDEERRLAAGSVDAPGETKVLIIGDSIDPPGQRKFARKVAGAVTVEAVDLRDLTDFGRALDTDSADALTVSAGYAEDVMSNFGGEDLVRSVAAAKANTLGRAPTRIEASALTFETVRSLAAVSDLLVAINEAGGAYCYRPAVLAATQRALQLASPPDGQSLAEATVIIREQSRLICRPTVGTPLQSGAPFFSRVWKRRYRSSSMPKASMLAICTSP